MIFLTFIGGLSVAGVCVAGMYWLANNVRIGNEPEKPTERKEPNFDFNEHKE